VTLRRRSRVTAPGQTNRGSPGTSGGYNSIVVISRVATWRRGLGAVSAALGIVLLMSACLIHLRYASDPSNLHVQERLEHVRILEVLSNAGLYGSMVLLVSSAFGLGWTRWVGLAGNFGALSFTLMTLGALCGPFGC
jgi:hypothetical protein